MLALCDNCGGTVWDFQDDLGPRCLSCSRGLEDAPTRDSLEAIGVLYNEFHKEGAGKGPRSKEFGGFHHGPRGHSQSEMGRRVRP